MIDTDHIFILIYREQNNQNVKLKIILFCWLIDLLLAQNNRWIVLIKILILNIIALYYHRSHANVI